MTTNTEGQYLSSAATVRGFAGGQRVLGRYRLQRVLGQGGMGIVWLAHDEELDRDVALKFLPDIVVNDRSSLNDLKRETRRSLELTHPNIVRTYDFVQDSAVAGISMEYVDCDTLRNLRIDQPGGVFQPSQVGEWTSQLCSALDYAHMNAAIVHRDLKPANLMVNGRGQLKIADFGIARSLVESVSLMTMRGGVSGTLVYMSPQQLSGDAATPSDDIYATGATLYDLLTSRPPFYTGDVTSQIIGKQPPSMAERRASLNLPVGELPENWERTIAACLAKDPAARPRTAGEIAVNLGLAEAASIQKRETPVPPLTVSPSSTSGTGPISTIPGVVKLTPPPPPVIDPPRKRNLLVAIGVPAFSAALVILAALLFWITRKPAEPQAPVRIAAAITPAPSAAPTPTPAPVAPALGGIMITTDPPGATVTVGNLPPKKSPAAFSDVPAGEQPVQVSMDGYDTAATTTTVSGGKINELPPITLVRSKGPLAVVSTPPGLPYVVKFKPDPLLSTTGTTPLNASEMPAGDYDITVTRDGWPPQERTVTVTKGRPQTAVFDFPGANISVTSDPPGAKVQANGKPIGVTPLVLTDMPPGPVTYTLQLTGYEDASVNGAVGPGATVVLQSDLRKKTRTVITHTATIHTRHHHVVAPAEVEADAHNSNGDTPPADGESFGSQLKRSVIAQLTGGIYTPPVSNAPVPGRLIEPNRHTQLLHPSLVHVPLVSHLPNTHLPNTHLPTSSDHSSDSKNSSSSK